MEEEKHTANYEEAKRKLEDSYCVTITDGAFDQAVQGLKTFDSKLISDASALEILDGACKLVLERFRNCAYESSFYEEAYQLRWALVELIEERRSSFVPRVRRERDCASIFMNDFLDRWGRVVESSGGSCVLTRERAEKLKDSKNKASSYCLDDVARFLNDIRDDLTNSFSPLLTVNRAHVAEVLSNLSDIPLTQFLLSINDYQKQNAMHMTNMRVLEQEHVIRDIYETLASSSTSVSSTRPRGLFLLLGRSGSGKTEIAKAVAEHWYCDASRLVEIDMSEINNADESVLRRRLSEIVSKRPYSVIVLDKIEKASLTVTRVLQEILSKPHTSDLDLSSSIIFMTSSVGSKHLGLLCKCHQRDEEDSRKQFLLKDLIYSGTHDSISKCTGSERALDEAKKFFSADLLDLVDKVLAVKRNHLAIFRLLLREIVRQHFSGQRLVVHASDRALVFLIKKNRTQFVEGGKASKRVLVEQVIPLLPTAGQDLNNVVVYIDKLGGASELSFSVFRHKQSADDWYFKLKDGTFDRLMDNLRTKVESVGRIFKLRSDYLAADSNSSDHELLADKIFNEILMWSPFQEKPRDIYKDATESNALSSWGKRQKDVVALSYRDATESNAPSRWGKRQEELLRRRKPTTAVTVTPANGKPRLNTKKDPPN